MDAVAEDKDCVMANVLAAVYRRNKLQLSAAHLAVAKANLVSSSLPIIFSLIPSAKCFSLFLFTLFNVLRA